MSRKRRPTWPYSLNRASPQAVGLLNWWTFPFGGGAAVDLAQGRSVAATPNAGTTQYADPQFGVGVSYAGAQWHNQPAPDAPYLGALTILSWVTITGETSFNMLAHKGGVATDNAFEYRLSFSGSLDPIIVRANAGGYRTWTVVGLGPVDRMHCAVSCPSSIDSAPTFYLDGVAHAATDIDGAGTGAPTGSGADILLGKRSDDLFFNGAVFDVRIYGRQMTDSEVKEQYLNPWELYAQPRRRSYFIEAAPGGFIPYPRPRGLVAGTSVMAGGM